MTDSISMLESEVVAVTKVIDEAQSQIDEVSITVTRLTVVRDALQSQIKLLNGGQLDLDFGGEE